MEGGERQRRPGTRKMSQTEGQRPGGWEAQELRDPGEEQGREAEMAEEN